MSQTILESVISTLKGYLDFHDKIAEYSIEGWPTFAQSIRIKSLLENKRVLIADGTGVNGKTFTSAALKFYLDRTEKKRHPTLVISPNSGLLEAWSPDNISYYAGKVDAPKQKVLPILSYEDLDLPVDDVDFAVINWEKLSIGENDRKWSRLEGLINRMDPDYFIFDEFHNAKTAGSSRGKTVQRLVKFTEGKYVALLSATPIPNRYRDLSMVFHMLDPKKYSDPLMFSGVVPEIIQELFSRQVWFRLTTKDLKEQLGLKDLNEGVEHYELSREEADTYFKIWTDCVSLGQGFSELRKALFDYRKSSYYGGKGRRLPSKLLALEGLVDKYSSKGKVIVKTNLVTGVIESMEELLSKKHNVLIVTGSTPREERTDIFKLFRSSDVYDTLILSSVGEESVDLTTGETPCTIIASEPEITPREHDQTVGRVYRRGQKGQVTHITLVAKSDYLNRRMNHFVDKLRKAYDIKIPRRFVARTIEEDMYAMRLGKEAVVEKIMSGRNVSLEEISLHDVSDEGVLTHCRGILPPSSLNSMGPFQWATLVQANWRSAGEEKFKLLTQTKGWKTWTKMYEKGWEGSASYATLEWVGRIIDDIENENGYSPLVIDEGSGAAYLSRATGRSAVCLDIDQHFLDLGKDACSRMNIPNTYVKAKATDTGLADRIADVVVNSYMLFYLTKDEIERCAEETNRILKKGGSWIVALPYTVEKDSVSNFSTNLSRYGFKERRRISPCDSREERMRNGCYIMVYEKLSEASLLEPIPLALYTEKTRFVA